MNWDGIGFMTKSLGKNQGLRCFPVKNYLIFYYPDETKNTVYAIRIIYGGRDISHQLSETETI